MINNILDDIFLARNNGAYISALSLALTLPNILSNIEFNRRTFRKEYVDWFNQWVYKYYEQPPSDNEFINRGLSATKFDGENCYALRCSLLHAGNTDLKDNKWKIDIFVLCSSDVSTHSGDAYVCDVSNNSANNTYVSLNIVGLIDALLAGAKEYISQNEEKIQQYQHSAMHRVLFGSIEIENL